MPGQAPSYAMQGFANSDRGKSLVCLERDTRPIRTCLRLTHYRRNSAEWHESQQ
jgi:hypothetical protein